MAAAGEVARALALPASGRTTITWASQAHDPHSAGRAARQPIDSQLQFPHVGRAVNSSRYEGSETKKPTVNSQLMAVININHAFV